MRIARLIGKGAIVATAVAGILLPTTTPANASGVYACYSWTEINNPSNGYTITYYPFPDGVSTSRCAAQPGGGGAGIELPLGLG